MGESAYRATWTRIVSDSLQTGSSTHKINSRASQQPVRHFNETYGTEFKMKADAYQRVGQHVQHRAASTRTVHTFPCSENEYTPTGRKTCVDQGKDGLQRARRENKHILLLLLMVITEYATDQDV